MAARLLSWLAGIPRDVLDHDSYRWIVCMDSVARKFRPQPKRCVSLNLRAFTCRSESSPITQSGAWAPRTFWDLWGPWMKRDWMIEYSLDATSAEKRKIVVMRMRAALLRLRRCARDQGANVVLTMTKNQSKQCRARTAAAIERTHALLEH